MKVDVVVVGGGITGAAIARKLARFRVSVALIDKEVDFGFGGATKANTAIIHAGYDDLPGTSKAELCVKGNALWEKTATELEIPFKTIGSLVVALNEEQVQSLRELERRGHENRVPGLRLIEDTRKLRAMERRLNREACAALHAPTAAITSPYEAAMALAENAQINGVQILLATRVVGVSVKGAEVQAVETERGAVECSFLVNCSGLWADEVSRLLGIAGFNIIPRKGEYFVLDRKLKGFLRHVLFPLPTPVSKGIVATPSLEGNIIIGPNSHEVKDKEDTSTTSVGLNEVWRGASKLVPSLSTKKGMIINSYAGLRADPDTGDFIIRSYPEVHGFINAAGIKSPGLTCAPAIAEKVASILETEGLELIEKEIFKPQRNSIPNPFRGRTLRKASELISQDGTYGRVVCRCEQVTEGEITEAIRRGATTVDGVKFRTRAGMGRCQGGFCTPRVIQILSKQLGIPQDRVTKCGKGSRILASRVKEPLLR